MSSAAQRSVPVQYRLLASLLRSSPEFRSKGRIRSWLQARLIGKGYHTVGSLPGGERMYLSLDDWIPLRIFVSGCYDLEELHAHYFLGSLAKDDYVLDVGANIGYYTVQIASQVSEGVVHAFEPVTETFATLTRNVALNQLRNVRLNQLIVADEEASARGELSIFLSARTNSGSSSLVAAAGHHAGESERVPCTTVDEYLYVNQVPRVDACKIDVEGAELKVLRGMRRLLSEGNPRLFVEINREMLEAQGASPREVIDYLAGFGYVAHRITSGGPVRTLDAGDDPLMMFCKVLA